LRIRDDGRGSAIVPGNGLSGMRERLEALGGSLRIDSGSSKGTRIEAQLPLPPGHATARAETAPSIGGALTH
jgi:two-component system sensor histidine kinase DesK